MTLWVQAFCKSPKKCAQSCCREKNVTYRQMAALNFPKIFFLKNAKKTCKPNNRFLNRVQLTAPVNFQSPGLVPFIFYNLALRNEVGFVH